MEKAMDSLTDTFQEVTISPLQKYNKYNHDQIKRFIYLIQKEGLFNIPRSSVYKLLNEFNAGCRYILPVIIQRQVKRSPKSFSWDTKNFLSTYLTQIL